MTKKQFLTKLMHERDKFELLLNRVGYTRRMTMKGVAGKWSIKDVLAYILAYEQFIADRMAEIIHGTPYIPCRTQIALDAFLDEFGYPDFGSPLLDEMNPRELIVEKYKNVSLDDIITQDLQAFSSIVASLERMSEETIERHSLYDRIGKHTYQLYRNHATEIKRWLKVYGVQIN
ncbi:MAG: hypothetical protein QM730_17555 [Anaerolineales bacterium]